MTVRIFIDWFLPAYKAGGPVQTITNLVGEELEGITYKLVCSNKDLDGSISEVERNQWLRFNQWTSIYYSSQGVKKHLLGEENEILFINGIYSWQYNLKPILFSRAGYKIVSVRGMLHSGALSQKAVKKRLFLALWKLAGIHRRVAFHACDKTEEQAIREVFGGKVRVHLAANLPGVLAQQKVMEKKRGELDLVSLALISPMKSIELVLQALASVPEKINYHLYGPVKDAAYWRLCQALAGQLPGNIRVHYHGDVHPSKLEQALLSGQVFILPSKSENFGHALYEAMSAGKPLITSRHTPWIGLEEAKAGRNVDLPATADLAAAIRFFAAMDRDELQVWCDGAKAYADAAIDREAIKTQYREMFRPGPQKTWQQQNNDSKRKQVPSL